MSLDRMKDRLAQIQARVNNVKGKGEEATKQALVLPWLDALGYDIWNPDEVCPEFEADFAVKKAGQKEKVDLAICICGACRIFLEVKSADTVLDGHEGQLARYFNGVRSVCLGILTNGVEYRFFTDTGEPNMMDQVPFYTVRMDGFDLGIDVLSKFHKTVFSPESIREYATELNYTSKIVGFLRGELDIRNREPSEGLIRWILASEGMYDGRVIASVVDRFRPIVKNALQIVLKEVVRRSVAALDEGVVAPETKVEPAPAVEAPHDGLTSEPPTVEPEGRRAAISTSDNEIAAFGIIKAQFDSSALADGIIFDAALKKDVPLELAYKDTTAYFGVYFNKPSQWFARLMMDTKAPWIGINLPADIAVPLLPAGVALLPPHAYAEVRVPITGPNDLHALNQVLFAAMKRVVEERRPKE